ncbi:MAG: thermonuclease family protein [Cyanobacteria bacterium P01_H01_bin.121]
MTTIQQPPEIRIVEVTDGDTVKVSRGEETISIRLACEDAPELDQPEGPASRARLQQLLPVGSQVTVNVLEVDRFGRSVAILHNSTGLDVNFQMVLEGQALVYPGYLENCDRSLYLSAEVAARAAGLGVWGSPDFTPPWQYRRNRRCDPSYPDICIAPASPQLSCRDIEYRDFRVTGADRHRFDGNKNGIGCET